MAIIAREPESKFTPAPEGLHPAVCVDVIDLGMVEGQFGAKHKVELRWQIEDVNPEIDKRFQVRKRYTLSLHKKASLRTELETWRGRKFTEEELRGFDLEKLISVCCQLQVIHNITDEGGVWANVQAIVPYPRGMAKLAPEGYVREKDREHTQGNGGPNFDMAADDDSVPF
jgi:hypothetical protein